MIQDKSDKSKTSFVRSPSDACEEHVSNEWKLNAFSKLIKINDDDDADSATAEEDDEDERIVTSPTTTDVHNRTIIIK